MMSKSNLEAVLVVGHGSRREEANEDVRDAALNIARRGPISLVTTAFLEIAKPSIGEGFARLVELGAQRILLVGTTPGSVTITALRCSLHLR